MILDTDYLIDLQRGHRPAFEKGIELFEQRIPRRVSPATYFELFYGVELKRTQEELREVENVLMGYPIVDVDERVGRFAGQMLAKADREAGGESGVDIGDAYIGATARLENEPVLTRNTDDFEKLPGVDVETY